MKKLVFVTGAGRGIGQAIALHLIKQGYVVTGCSRTLTQLKETQKFSEGKIRIAEVDVKNSSAIEKWMTSEIAATQATPWGLVTAAGIYGPIGNFLENSWDEWRQGIEINLYGTALALKSFARILIEQKHPGRIVLLSGGGATQPIPNFTSYCASKSAVVRLGETVAHELRAHRITVNSIAPGAVNTQLTDDLIKAGPEKAGKLMYEKALQQKQSGGADPSKAAALTSYLLSEQASGITGKLISAIWDPWETMHEKAEELSHNDVYTLKRVTPS